MLAKDLAKRLMERPNDKVFQRVQVGTYGPQKRPLWAWMIITDGDLKHTSQATVEHLGKGGKTVPPNSWYLVG